MLSRAKNYDYIDFIST